MKVIGITGGVGAGKSQILEYLGKKKACRVIMADQVAHMLEEPGQVCYERITDLLGADILASDGRIDKGKMAGRRAAVSFYRSRASDRGWLWTDRG